MKKLDGTGAKLDDKALYFVQDARTAVGNCGSWWAPKGDGYVCNIDQAGLYTGAQVREMRDTDVPWPEAYVRKRIIPHVRVDNADFRRRDKKPDDANAIVAYARKLRELYVEDFMGSADDPKDVALEELFDAIDRYAKEAAR